MNNAVIVSLIRTVVVPTIVGWVVQALVLINNEDPSDGTRAAITAVAGMVWYIIARFAAAWNPKFGVLLLIAAQPEYVTEEDGEDKARDDFLLGVQRTVVPIAAGWGITQLVRLGVNIDTASATLLLQGVITSAYYGILRWIEEWAKRRNQPEATSATVAGVMLGAPAELTY